MFSNNRQYLIFFGKCNIYLRVPFSSSVCPFSSSVCPTLNKADLGNHELLFKSQEFVGFNLVRELSHTVHLLRDEMSIYDIIATLYIEGYCVYSE